MRIDVLQLDDVSISQIVDRTDEVLCDNDELIVTGNDAA